MEDLREWAVQFNPEYSNIHQSCPGQFRPELEISLQRILQGVKVSVNLEVNSWSIDTLNQ